MLQPRAAPATQPAAMSVATTAACVKVLLLHLNRAVGLVTTKASPRGTGGAARRAYDRLVRASVTALLAGRASYLVAKYQTGARLALDRAKSRAAVDPCDLTSPPTGRLGDTVRGPLAGSGPSGA